MCFTDIYNVLSSSDYICMCVFQNANAFSHRRQTKLNQSINIYFKLHNNIILHYHILYTKMDVGYSLGWHQRYANLSRVQNQPSPWTSEFPVNIVCNGVSKVPKVHQFAELDII